MKKTGLLVFTLSLCALALTGCNSKCECECDNAVNGEVVNENAALDKATQDCVDKWWTHSLIHSQTAAYGECAFPSWVICEDRALAEWECQYEADTTNIENEEKRLAGCEESVNDWIKNIENWEVMSIDWEDESEAWASFARRWVVKYSKYWDNRKIVLECVADFVDWSISVSYDEAVNA